jgi:hypothetical protein
MDEDQVERPVAEHLIGHGHVAAADELHRAVWRRRDGRRRGRLGILAQDRQLQIAQPRRRLDAQLLVEPPAEALVGGERLGLAARAVEGEHELAVRALAQRVRRDQQLELGDELAGRAAGEIRLDALLQAVQSQVIEPRAFGCREGLGELGHRRSAPQRQGVAQVARRPQPLELVQVEDVLAPPARGRSRARACTAGRPGAPCAAARRRRGSS